ncbi:MAG: ABC-F family ATP-binding cassette domain-containing protein [Alphaproteobacteria bacterium]|nr:ABC-F family ATP-binding cassette domain-containing protein [Alphaproteobacteria bacterium]
MLSLQSLSYRVGGRTLLDDVSVNIPAGWRIGLVGPNGAGKTTLFKIIAGDLAPDGGAVSFIKGASLGMVRQDLPNDDTTILDVVLAADTERAALMKEVETTEDMDRIGYIYDRLNEIGAYEAPSRAASILAGLGFSDAAQNSAISSFSGGWRARVALAAALFLQPNVLLLDEPTNHLDFESLVWLENFMMRYSQTLIVISHDRDILNKTVDHILHLENQKLTLYTGNYDQFERERAQKLMNQQSLHEKQMAHKAHLMKFVDRFRASAAKARQAQSRLKAIERMDIVDAVIAERVTAFTFPQPKELKPPMIRLDHVDAGYVAGSPVLRGLNLSINPQDRIALLGANGNGKSTLIKILSGRLQPMTGTMFRSGQLKIGYFAQFQTDELDVELTPFEALRAAMNEPSEVKVRAMLSGFGFTKSKADTKIGGLSGGEKARLLFCMMSFDQPHIMLLDEPTNHLDMDARQALIQALNDYTGAVIIVSHDTHLVERVADQLWLVADGKCQPFDDDLDAYRKLVIKQRRQEREKLRQAVRAGKAADEPRGDESAADIERDIKKQEDAIAGLTQRKHMLEGDIAQCFEQGKDAKHLAQLNAAYEKTVAELAAAEEALLALMERA